MRVLICDGDPEVRERLYRIAIDAGISVIGRVDNVEKAMSVIRASRPEIVLMDVNLSGATNVLAVLQKDMTCLPAMILMGVESDCNFAVLKSGASDFLLKPLNRADVLASFTKVCQLSAAQQMALSRKSSDKQSEARQFIAARTHRGVELIAMKDVYYFTADQKYVKVRHKNGIVFIDESLKTLEEEFEGIMYRIHRNALINLDYLELLESVDAGQYRVRFRGMSDALTVSRRHLPTLRERIHSI